MALPACFAFILPVLLTLTTDFLEEDQVTFFALDTLSCLLCPTEREISVTVSSAFLPAAWAVSCWKHSIPINNAATRTIRFTLFLIKETSDEIFLSLYITILL